MSAPHPATVPVYYEDAYTRDFEATVLHVGSDHFVLDRTCFYPEGGGQPGDRGTVGGAYITDTRKGDSGVILHRVDPAQPHGLETGQTVSCSVDWAWRFDFMQQHTGQHVLSASFLRVAGMQTVSVHQGLEYTTIELDGEELAADALIAVENEANRVINENLPVQAYEVDEADVDRLNLRRAPKVSGRIRIVEIPETDRVACGGVHTRSTGEVGLLRLCAVERIRGNVRYAWFIGRRAHEHHRFAHHELSALSTLLSVPAAEVRQRVQELDAKLKDAERQIVSLTADVARSRGDALARAADTAEGSPRTVVEDLGEVDSAYLRTVADVLSAQPGMLAVLMARQSGRAMWAVSHGEGLSIDPQALRSQAFPVVAAKGGGKSPLWQGAMERPEAFGDFARAVRECTRPAP